MNLPKDHPPIPASAESCPYSAERQEKELSQLNNMPLPSQIPAQDQKIALPVDREVSSIPMGGKFQGKKWIYPSEQMFYNAMKRKNWNPDEKDMHTVVPIHNIVNEKVWNEILAWESLEDSKECGGPKLLKFKGRPTEYSPRARLWQLFGYKLPFDRHDWTVERCEANVTYIIDFYSAETTKDGVPSIFLDVRPDLSLTGIKLRFKKWQRDGFW